MSTCIFCLKHPSSKTLDNPGDGCSYGLNHECNVCGEIYNASDNHIKTLSICFDVLSKIKQIEYQIRFLEEQKIKLIKELKNVSHGELVKIGYQCNTDNLICMECVDCKLHTHLKDNTIQVKMQTANKIIDKNKCIICGLHIKNPNYKTIDCQHKLPEE